jgi:hypothetical protein
MLNTPAGQTHRRRDGVLVLCNSGGGVVYILLHAHREQRGEVPHSGRRSTRPPTGSPPTGSPPTATVPGPPPPEGGERAYPAYESVRVSAGAGKSARVRRFGNRDGTHARSKPKEARYRTSGPGKSWSAASHPAGGFHLGRDSHSTEGRGSRKVHTAQLVDGGAICRVMKIRLDCREVRPPTEPHNPRGFAPWATRRRVA